MTFRLVIFITLIILDNDLIMQNKIHILLPKLSKSQWKSKFGKKMIQEAKKCGANAVKFQTFIADKLATRILLKLHIKK